MTSKDKIVKSKNITKSHLRTFFIFLLLGVFILWISISSFNKILESKENVCDKHYPSNVSMNYRWNCPDDYVKEFYVIGQLGTGILFVIGGMIIIASFINLLSEETK